MPIARWSLIVILFTLVAGAGMFVARGAKQTQEASQATSASGRGQVDCSTQTITITGGSANYPDMPLCEDGQVAWTADESYSLNFPDCPFGDGPCSFAEGPKGAGDRCTPTNLCTAKHVGQGERAHVYDYTITPKNGGQSSDPHIIIIHTQ
jgi:hypothetical protein